MRRKFDVSQKQEAVKRAGIIGINAAAREYKIDAATLRRWIANYDSMGVEGLYTTGHWTKRSEVEKIAAVRAYEEGGSSLQSICKQFKIRSTSQLRNWIIRYNGHEKLKPTINGGEIDVTKGRKVTFNEKIEIVEFCIESGNDYAATIEKYKVSYQQIYSWVRKYAKGGISALEDRRGKVKEASELTEADKLNAKIKLLEAQNRRLEMENDLLKKLEEIERRWF